MLAEGDLENFCVALDSYQLLNINTLDAVEGLASFIQRNKLVDNTSIKVQAKVVLSQCREKLEAELSYNIVIEEFRERYCRLSISSSREILAKISHLRKRRDLLHVCCSKPGTDQFKLKRHQLIPFVSVHNRKSPYINLQNARRIQNQELNVCVNQAAR